MTKSRMAFGAAVVALACSVGEAAAVGLADVTVEGNQITIGPDKSFPKYEGWIPSGEDSKTVIWRDKRLSDVKALRAKMNGAWLGSDLEGHGLIVSRSETRIEVQFICHDDGYNKAVRTYFEQDGEDIVAWGDGSGCVWDSLAGTPLSNFWLQVSTDKGNGAYGVYGVEALDELEVTVDELQAVAQKTASGTLVLRDGLVAVTLPEATAETLDCCLSGDATVSISGCAASEIDALGNGEQLTVSARTILPRCCVQGLDVVSAKSAGLWMAGDNDMTIHHVTRTATTLSFQAQRDSGVHTQSVLVELSNAADGVAARVVWGRYAERAQRAVGEDFSTGSYGEIGNSDGAMYYTLSHLVVKSRPTVILASEDKSAWTLWGLTVDGVAARVTNSPLAARSRTVVTRGGSLFLETQGGTWSGGDNRWYVVEKDSLLFLSVGGCALADGAKLILDGGHVQARNEFNYVNDLTIANGGGVRGTTPVRVGFSRDVTWTVNGPESVLIEPGIRLVQGDDNEMRTWTIQAETDTTIRGQLEDVAPYNGATLAKAGEARLTLESENSNHGPFKVLSGSLVFAHPKAVKSENAVELAGGTLGLAAGTDGVTAGPLSLSGTAELDATNGTFAFGDSAAAAWQADARLYLKVDGPTAQSRARRVRFGMDANALTPTQLSQIRYAEGVTDCKSYRFSLDAEGYLQDNISCFCVLIQ